MIVVPIPTIINIVFCIFNELIRIVTPNISNIKEPTVVVICSYCKSFSQFDVCIVDALSAEATIVNKININNITYLYDIMIYHPPVQ